MFITCTFEMQQHLSCLSEGGWGGGGKFHPIFIWDKGFGESKIKISVNMLLPNLGGGIQQFIYEELFSMFNLFLLNSTFNFSLDRPMLNLTYCSYKQL